MLDSRRLARELNCRFKVFPLHRSRFVRRSVTVVIAVLAAYLIGMEPARTGSLGASLFYILLGWTLAAGLLLCVYSISSLEEIRSLLRVSLLSSAPAMWFVPAVLLICAPAPASIAIGLLLVANTVRVLVSRGLSRQVHIPSARRHRVSRQIPTVQLFSSVRASPAFKSESATVLLGALAFQLGIAAIWAGYGLTSAVLFGTAATAWTLAAIAKGVFLPRRQVDSLMRAALTLLLTTAISVRQLSVNTQAVSDPTLPQMTYLTLQSLIHRDPLVREPPRKKVTRVLTPVDVLPPVSNMLAEGVILRPEFIRPRLSIIVSPGRVHLLRSSPMRFRFTGEYRLFPVSSNDLKKDWAVQTGTPVDSIFATVSGRPLQTEAYQILNPPVDFTTCRTLQLSLVSREAFPAAAIVQLIGNRKVPDLGPEIFGLDRTPEETVEFAIPVSLRGLRVTGIRIIFKCIAAESSRSLRVAVQGFNLIPARL